jgi:hypothetical protein
MWRLDLGGAVTTEIVIALIVYEYENDIGFISRANDRNKVWEPH